MQWTALALVTIASFLGPQDAERRAAGVDWPRWRGPTWDGVAAASAAPPSEWSEARNVRWKVALPGLGTSTPIVVGQRIYLTAAIDLGAPLPGTAPDAEPTFGPQPGPPNKDHVHRSIVMALDRATGAEVWRTTVHEGTPHEKGHATGSHASASPSCDGQRIIASFGSRGLYALGLDGQVLWSKQLGQMTTLEGFGEASSPALYGDTVVVQWDEEGPSFVAAFDARTGAERWRQPRESDSSWGSPVVAPVAGEPQVILTGSDTTRAYDLATGAQLWSCAGMSKNPVNTPVVADGSLYVMNSYKGNVIQALRLGEGPEPPAKGALLVWTKVREGSYVPTPLAHDGRLYYLRGSSGVLNCLAAGTGEPLYEGRRLGDLRTVHASPILAAGRLYFPSRAGQTAVVKAGDEYELLATNTLDDVFDASAVAVGSELFLRGRSHLYCIAAPR